MKLFAILGILLVIGISAVVVGYNSDKISLPSSAAGLVPQASDLGLTLDVQTGDNGLTKVAATWNKQPGNVLFYNIKMLKADGSRVAKADSKNLGQQTSKVFSSEPLASGLYNVYVKAYYSDKILEEIQPFTVINPLNANLTNLILNPGFETVIPVDQTKPTDFDPTNWITAEGIFKTKTLKSGGTDETGILLTEQPNLIQVVGADNNVQPKQTSMAKINPGPGNKAHLKYHYTPPITNARGGTFIQRLSVYVPEQNSYSQRLEIRKLAGGEHLRVFWQKNIKPSNNGSAREITSPITEVCFRGPAPANDPGGGKQGYCTDLPGIETNKWNNYEFKLQKLPQAEQWKFTMSLNGEVVLKTGKNGVPSFYVPNQIGLLFIGDECQGSASCYDGLGTFYYDNAEAFYVKP